MDSASKRQRVEGNLNDAEEAEARRIAEIAARAEARALERAKQRGQQQGADRNLNKKGVVPAPQAAEVVVSRTVQPKGLFSSVEVDSGKGSPGAAANGKGSVAGGSVAAPVKFMTKAERERLALERLEERRKKMEEERRQAEERRKLILSGQLPPELQKEKEQEEKEAREAQVQAAKEQGRDNRSRRGTGRSRSPERGRSRNDRRVDGNRDRRDRGDRRRDRRGDRDRERSSDRGGGRGGSRSRDRGGGRGARDRDDRGRHGASPSRSASRDAAGGNGAVLSEEESKRMEQEAIKQRYLGQKKAKRIVIKPSEKFTRIFQFDWDASEDTSEDYNPLYADRHQASLMFGRGYVAGIDYKEQRKNSKFLDELVRLRTRETEILKAQSAAEAEERLRKGEIDEEQRRKLEASAKERAAELEEVRRRQDKAMKALQDTSMGEKGGHWSEKPLEKMTERDWRIFREDFDIRVRGGRAPKPLRYWKEAKLPRLLADAIEDCGYKDPTPIQRQGIPIGLKQRDIIGVAETGSGKTAAFVIPMLMYILKLPDTARKRTGDEGPLAIVMAPTRELAQQIETETQRLGKYMGVRTVSIVGGSSIQAQGHALRSGVDIVIGTPGRIIDCLENRYMVLNQCKYIVLDEADRMIDLGFEPQVLQVMDSLGGGGMKSLDEAEAQRQEEEAERSGAILRTTVMFTATMPPEVEKLAKEYLRHPVIVTIGDQQSGKNKRIEQKVLMLSEGAKQRALDQVLKTAEFPVIVFVNLKKNCDIIGKKLENQNFRVCVLHGGKSQDMREEALEYFKDGYYDILVATDVAGRGLDIEGIQHVINYDMPSDIDRYSHRIGRTGRAGKEGKATSFVTEDDAPLFYELKKYLESTNSQVPHELANHPAARPPATLSLEGSGKK